MNAVFFFFFGSGFRQMSDANLTAFAGISYKIVSYNNLNTF